MVAYDHQSLRRREAAGEEKVILQIQAQMYALEMVLKATLAMTLVSRVKDPLEATQVADLARQMKGRLTAAAGLIHKRPELAQFSDLAAEFECNVTSTIARCFDESTQMLDLIAQAGLELAEPPTNAKN